MAKGVGMIMMLGLGVFFIGAWLVAMAGLAAITDQVSDTWMYSLQWFVLFWQLALALAIAAVAPTKLARRMYVATIAFVAMMSPLWCMFAYEAYLRVRTSGGDGQVNGSTSSDNRLNTWIAGCSLLFIFNFFAVAALAFVHGGSDDTAPAAAAPAKGTSAPGVPGVPVSQAMPAANVV